MKKLKKIIVILSILSSSGFIFLLGIVCVASATYEQQGLLVSKKADEHNKAKEYTGATLPLSSQVESYREYIYVQAEEAGIAEYTDLLLAVMMQESGGEGKDVFNCLDITAGTETDITAEASIEQAINIFKDYIKRVNVKHPKDMLNIRLVLQAYNFDKKYISFALGYSKGWSQDATYLYARQKSNYQQRTGAEAQTLGIWNYGDQYYTDHVLQYYTYIERKPEDDTEEDGKKKDVVYIAIKRLGCLYRWGGVGPTLFDCSGLVYYCYKKAGVYTGMRTTASGYKEIAIPISEEEAEPGDLVFFTDSEGNTHHVGIYKGNGKMIHAPQEGECVEISEIWRTETVTFGRLSDAESEVSNEK